VILTRRIVVEKRRVLVPLAIAIVANVLLYVLVVFPLGRQVANAEANARAAHDTLRQARLEYLSANATVTGKKQADAALQKFYKDVLPANQSIARRVTYTRLAELAKQANVKLEHGVNAVRHEKGSVLSKLTTTYTLTGDYRDVRRFIYSLETAPEFVILDDVALASNAEQQNRGLAMTLEISTYFRTGDVAD
jgi:type IV pilus assembly protein PilO